MHEPHAEERVAARGARWPGPDVKMPVVAAIVCNYNQKAYVEAAIASVARQTYPYLECVVVDDCSSDGSAEVIARALAAHGGRPFRFIQHPENRGQMAAMLSGLDATTAPFVAWIDADDIWFPEYIERHVAHHLNSQVNAAISTSNMAVIDGEGTLIGGADPSMSISSPMRKWERVFSVTPARLLQHGKEPDFGGNGPPGPVFINRHYEAWVWSPTSGMVFRTAAVSAIRPLSTEGLRICADHYLARFAHVVGGTIWIGETLGCYRVHGTNGFAKRTVHGDGALGTEPKRITTEGNYQFALKLEKSEVLAKLLAEQHVARLAVEIGRGPRAIRKVLANETFRRRLRFKQRFRLWRRYIASLLRLPGYI
ncbi:MAG TPA: glycosyltransferase [Hyphomicrobiaceae bacterium]